MFQGTGILCLDLAAAPRRLWSALHLVLAMLWGNTSVQSMLVVRRGGGGRRRGAVENDSLVSS